MVTLPGSGIETLEDLKGKRVAISPAGGGTLSIMTRYNPSKLSCHLIDFRLIDDIPRITNPLNVHHTELFKF